MNQLEGKTESCQKLICRPLALALAVSLLFAWSPTTAIADEVASGSAKSASDKSDFAKPGSANTTGDWQAKEPESIVATGRTDKWWTTMHDKLVKQAASSHPDTVIFGDSITAFMNINLLHKILGPEAVNFGI